MSFVRLLFVVLGTATVSARSAVMPHVSIGMSTGDATAGLGKLEPILGWSAEKKIGDVSVEGGITVKVEDVESFPYSVWGKLKRSIGRWDVSARTDASSVDLTSWDVDLEVAGGSSNLQIKGAVNTASPAATVSDLKLKHRVKGFLGGAWTLFPRYNIPARRADIRVAYEFEDTSIAIDASGKKQKVTVSQRIGSNDAIAPSITTDGEFELEYRHSLASGSLAAAYKPNDSVTITWQDGPWQASFKAPMDGIYKVKEGVKVNIRTRVDIV